MNLYLKDYIFCILHEFSCRGFRMVEFFCCLKATITPSTTLRVTVRLSAVPA
jgi:hypothetical protein